MKLAKGLGIATIAAISVAAVGVQPTQAAIVNYNFIVDATSGSNPGQYFGSLKYDDSFLTSLGLETLGVENGLEVKFNYLGNTYTEVDDIDFDSFPIVSFNDGKFLGLSYFVADQFFIGDENNLDVGGNKFYLLDQSVITTEVGTVSYSQVPEPFAVSGIAIAGTVGLFMKRKKKATVAS
ncbi:PEP-CTERM sorting domain-containing protein [Nostoc parmelioides]|uniref:PEP-CTERM sorting domain-containing protein n=1 Tax=Nostoc parmelioides FACHB-3921 TaxID=2692909 RepID=A0ABR8BCT6_9NOSO|nr:PEP-CTERM sorting domain-containing protein [Nostoc parmelioides]MBD2250807.1 PEP-CTERM sorting domain-containing protein [Nostoc parmelioides FACHB-3921]